MTTKYTLTRANFRAPRGDELRQRGFDGCCQAFELYNFGAASVGVGVEYAISPEEADLAMTYLHGLWKQYTWVATTVSTQPHAAALLKALGFKPQPAYRATTGSTLTLWTYTPRS